MDEVAARSSANKDFDPMDQHRSDAEAVRQFRLRHPPQKIEPIGEETYRRAIDELMRLAGTEPDLVAPPRRKFD